MNRFLLIPLLLLTISSESMAFSNEDMLMNPLEVVDELPGDEARQLGAAHGLYPTKRTWLQRLFRPRYSPAAPPAACHAL